MKRRLENMRPLAVAGIVASVLVVLAGAGSGLWFYHKQPQFCANLCHIMQPYENAWASSDWEAHIHAEKGIVCLDCHEPTIKQQVKEVTKYLSKDYQTPLRQRKMPQAKCLSCKEHSSYPALAETTADWKRNPHNSHWGEMECVLCHKQHRPNVLYCTQCHNDLILPQGWDRATGS